MTQLSAVGVPAGTVLDSMELTDEPSFRQRGILQTMTHGERTMTMPTWPTRFDGLPTAVKSAPLLGEHTAEVLADWLGLDAAAGPRAFFEDDNSPRTGLGCYHLRAQRGEKNRRLTPEQEQYVNPVASHLAA